MEVALNQQRINYLLACEKANVSGYWELMEQENQLLLRYKNNNSN